jgi:hypothetical protein
MNNQDTLRKIESLAKQVCKPSRSITQQGERIISFTVFKTKHSRNRTMILVYRCRIIKGKDDVSTLLINETPTDSNDEDKIYCLLLEYKKYKIKII